MNEFNSAEAEQNLADQATPFDALIEGDALIEEVSIDGMCGVY
ncbi:mycofactocin precursor MftA [Streptomyces carpinensis]|uniref:Mycofactocin MftA n=1 Tax=Streptomyces carpinensis TaxID=66369 RepID=A0ABV1WEU7_9ACTN|nr:mycofactocin precursor MftA [Streptomyces carpinensis]